jgi:hypothetical protein
MIGGVSCLVFAIAILGYASDFSAMTNESTSPSAFTGIFS